MHLTLLRDVEPDILALQEVSPSFHRAIDEARLFTWSAFSLSGNPELSASSRSRRLGCSIFGSAPFKLTSTSRLDTLVFPERTLMARIHSGSCPLTVCSMHILPGSSWGVVKPQTMESIARWLSELHGTCIVGMDANAPKVDHPDIERNVWWWAAEPLLLGGNPIHHLKDAFRFYLKTHPAELRAIIQSRPEGPLAVSHVRGSGRKRTECRYDFIYCSSEIIVESVSHMYSESMAAGSDHALVTASLRIALPGAA